MKKKAAAKKVEKVMREFDSKKFLNRMSNGVSSLSKMFKFVIMFIS